MEALQELGALARRARVALLQRDHAELRRCVDRSFDARQRMLELDPRHVEMVECARASGASANYTGSGGAIVAVCPDAEIREQRRALPAGTRLQDALAANWTAGGAIRAASAPV